ncbi:hypothetical protein [Saccharothrix sp. Mg75]|uniref:hypothetical protein n=1 Tax=Saccharothrix sp. Mg75 TaxID=3445357 RepID=UPI003EE9A26C
MAVLRSEADFTDPSLSREHRWLALYLVVHLADGHGRLSTACRRVLKLAARDRRHWAHNRSLGAVRAEVGRWIGPAARASGRPSWNRVAGLVKAAVDPAKAQDVLTTARYLHALASGGTPDPKARPAWLGTEVDEVGEVSTALIGGPEWARKHRLTPVLPADAPTDLPTDAPTDAPADTSADALPTDAPPADAPPADAPPADAPPTDLPPAAVVLTAPAAAGGVATAPSVPAPSAPADAQQADTPQAGATPSEAPQVGTALSEAPARTGTDPERSSYQLLWTVVRAHRDAQARYEARIAELEELVGDLRAAIAAAGLPGGIPAQRPRRRLTAGRHLALDDPAQAFTYPLPAELPEPRTATT